VHIQTREKVHDQLMTKRNAKGKSKVGKVTE
jgi:hypothetical protein